MAKLNGNTLVETLAAMVIIIFCSTMATVIYLNTLSSQNTGQKLKAYYMATEVINQSIQKKDFIDGSITANGLTVSKSCKPYQSKSNLIQIKVEVKSEAGKVLWSQNQLISNE